MSNQNAKVVPFRWATKERKRMKCLLEWRASISCLILSIYFCIICRRYFRRTNIFKATASIILHSHNLVPQIKCFILLLHKKYAEHSYISSVKMTPPISFFY